MWILIYTIYYKITKINFKQLEFLAASPVNYRQDFFLSYIYLCDYKSEYLNYITV